MLIGAIVGSILALLLLLALAAVIVRARRQRSDKEANKPVVDTVAADDNEMVSARADDNSLRGKTEYGPIGTLQAPMSEYDGVYTPLN